MNAKVKAAHGHKSTTHEEMYFHIRKNFRFNGKLMQGGTIFFRKVDNNLWRVAVSRCSFADNWCRSTGRTVARRRFFSGGNLLVEGDYTMLFSAKTGKPSLDLAQVYLHSEKL